MSRTEEIGTDVRAVGAAADDARAGTEESLELAREQIEFAQAHGWDGVAQSINIAVEALEKIAGELTTSVGSCETAQKTLDEISEQMSRSEVAHHLTLANSELETAYTTLEGTIALVDEGLQGTEQAEHDALTSRLNNHREEIEGLFEQLTRARTAIESEHEEAQNLGQQGGDGTAKGKRDEDGQDDQDTSRRSGEGSSGTSASGSNGGSTGH